MSYENRLTNIAEPSFVAIQAVAAKVIGAFSKTVQNQVHNELERGIAILQTSEQMCQYLNAFGNMHRAKLLDAFTHLPTDIFNGPFNIVDWGCGQGMGTINLFDSIRSKGMRLHVQKITLIEPSKAALSRAILHTSLYLTDDVEIVSIQDFFENVRANQITAAPGVPVIHIFSNILDVEQIDLKHLSNIIDNAVISDNYLVCVGPLNPNNRRIDAFYNYFDVPLLYQKDDRWFHSRWTYKCKLFQLSYNQQSHLLPIEFYPAVQFQAAYELDMVRKARRRSGLNLLAEVAHFEVTAPFDLGASVYEDVHPVLAVLNNIITRGIPTKASPYIEAVFAEAFRLSEKGMELGEITFEGKQDWNYRDHQDFLLQQLRGAEGAGSSRAAELQILLSPVAIARFQKVLVEAIITGHLSLEKEVWRVMVEEHDVPFAAVAVEDFRQMFFHLTQLTESCRDLKLPRIDLHVQTNAEFKDSPLHLDAKLYTDLPKALLAENFDLVVSLSTIKKAGDAADAFSKFNCGNDCYFNIRAIEAVRSERMIYTSDLIRYRKVVERSSTGVAAEVPEVSKHLSYFLQLLFRKETFRPGQLPILDRALQNLPVIGLLPTGGGKSLTYQIAAMLQPGVAMVIDPLKSLMRDQLDGLFSCGIDCCALINSTLSKTEREAVEKRLESSQLLFIFLSPERLSIASFRERLRHMHDYNVYFSYGIIDEVHCVSEWGHDFRFSYLHLGRNLYHYVRAKKGEISLFGLTATASFDVLADVERELSGNGAFPLDADVIVRHEHTDRLELQYKVERVQVVFDQDRFYDRNMRMPPELPKPVDIGNKWSVFESKGAYLSELIPKIPDYIDKLQNDPNLSLVRDRFMERQNVELNHIQEIRTAMPSDFLSEKVAYRQAGIVFCPHVETTGLSVRQNREKLAKKLNAKVGSFTGRDDDNTSMESLVSFRDNKVPLMVATKAFGMGIDKPNVRFTVNLNFSSSLESFVQEAGRAGRDRKLALATILFSDYRLVRINPKYQAAAFPLGIIKNKWFLKEDLETILSHFGLDVPESDIDVVTPSTDMVKLHCSTNNKVFAFNSCRQECPYFQGCNLGKVDPATKGWKTEVELSEELRRQGVKVSRRNYQYLNADYEVVMHFFNEAFKGDVVEKKYMNRLLNAEPLRVQYPGRVDATELAGFLPALLGAQPGDSVVVYFPYKSEEYADLSKAIYRMCCIELIVDFTQDYATNTFRIVASRKKEGGYFEGLSTFLKRYFTKERAALEIGKVRQYPVKAEGLTAVNIEIYQCLAYLTDFIYEKISEKRKRAIDDMRNFCLEGLQTNKSWIELNEDLKDFIFYYFNSKYASESYVADNGEPFSLVADTDFGKRSDVAVLFKYLRVVDDDLVGAGTPLDNIKHLLGAVRYIKRSLTDSNPTIALLEVFCLLYLGVNGNDNIKNQVIRSYSEGMIDFHSRSANNGMFWEFFDQFSNELKKYLEKKALQILIEETRLLVHAQYLSSLAKTYSNNNE